MSVQRFLPHAARLPSALSVSLVVIVAPGLAYLAYVLNALDAGVAATALLLALSAGAVFLAVRPFVWPSLFMEVDLARRTLRMVDDGVRSDSNPLESMAPLTVAERVTWEQVTWENDRSSRIQYVVFGAGHSYLDLFVSDSADAARAWMENLGREWRLSTRFLKDDVRPAYTVDRRLHERFRNDLAARTAVTLSPEWGVKVELSPQGYALIPTRRSWATLVPAGSLLALVMLVREEMPSAFQPETTDGDVWMRAILGGVFVVFLGLLVRGLWRFFHPVILRITPHGVVYGSARLSFSSIDEVSRTHPIEIIGDTRTIKLAPGFCAREGTDGVAHELRRLIIETGLIVETM
ncbi:MAG: hypothetical protein ABI672_17420 [Vicinamibacteria bacterium]